MFTLEPSITWDVNVSLGRCQDARATGSSARLEVTAPQGIRAAVLRNPNSWPCLIWIPKLPFHGRKVNINPPKTTKVYTTRLQ